MQKFTYVEDYLEVITGYRDLVTGKTNHTWAWSMSPIINLARYDVKVLESMTMTVAQSQPLTERQGELLCKIILKYERQLANKSIDVSAVLTPNWRIALRKMDYTQSLTIENDQLVIRFPFNNQLIESIREFVKTSQGKCQWDRDRKVWFAALTEYNLSWVYSWAEVHKFEIDNHVHNLMSLIKETEEKGYGITLDYCDNQLTIENAHESLVEYIAQHEGGLVDDNLLHLVDISPILGYTISNSIANSIAKTLGPRFYNLSVNRELTVNPQAFTTGDDFDTVMDYADSVGRWPVVIYEPDLSGRMLQKLQARYTEDLVVNVSDKNPEVPNNCKYIHTVVPIQNMTRIPLVISSAGMIFGGDKQLMIQRAEKIVYCAQDVYNKKAVGRKIKNITE